MFHDMFVLPLLVLHVKKRTKIDRVGQAHAPQCDADNVKTLSISAPRPPCFAEGISACVKAEYKGSK
jgi:hypothetical protein